MQIITSTAYSLVLLLNAGVWVRLLYRSLEIFVKARHVIPKQHAQTRPETWITANKSLPSQKQTAAANMP